MRKNTPIELEGVTFAEGRAELVTLPRIDEAVAVPRPSVIADTYMERESRELEDEQPLLFDASGRQAARALDAESAGLAPLVAAVQRTLAGHEPLLAGAERRHQDVLDTLSPFKRRGPKATLFHYATKAGLIVGDVATLAGSFVWLGEEVALAAIMGMSAAVATVTAGLSGSEVREIRSRRLRAKPLEELSETQRPYAHLFDVTDQGWSLVKVLMWASVATAGTIAMAVFALRASLEDPLVGMVFGGLAAAIATASFISSYLYGDDVATLIDNAEADYKREVARHLKLASSSAWRRREEAHEEAASILREHQSRGAAARHHMRSLRFGMLRRSPGVVGHGFGSETPVIGQAPRRAGGGQ